MSNLRIGLVGVGKIGQAIVYPIVMDEVVDEVLLYDKISDLAGKFEHEMRHAMATRGIKTNVVALNSLEELRDAEIVVITAGKGRKPGMSRRDLFLENARVMRDLASQLPKGNPNAVYVMVTNPVDMMASVFQRFSGRTTISTGDQVETMRMRSFIAKRLGVPVREVEGFVGGEHGEDAVVLWGTVRVRGEPFREEGLSRREVEEYVKGIAAEIIRVMGGTTWGPGTIIKDVIRSVALNEGRVMSIAFPREFQGEVIHVSEPVVVGRSIGPSLAPLLAEEDRRRLEEATGKLIEVFRANLKYLVPEERSLSPSRAM
jgi:malate dehydrogenase